MLGLSCWHWQFWTTSIVSCSFEQFSRLDWRRIVDKNIISFLKHFHYLTDSKTLLLGEDVEVAHHGCCQCSLGLLADLVADNDAFIFWFLNLFVLVFERNMKVLLALTPPRPRWVGYWIQVIWILKMTHRIGLLTEWLWFHLSLRTYWGVVKFADIKRYFHLVWLVWWTLEGGLFNDFSFEFFFTSWARGEAASAGQLLLLNDWMDSWQQVLRFYFEYIVLAWDQILVQRKLFFILNFLEFQRSFFLFDFNGRNFEFRNWNIVQNDWTRRFF